VPKLLQEHQLEMRANLSIQILNKWDANPDEFLQRIVTGDETWLYQYDPEDKQQSKQWLPRGSSGPIKGKAERSVAKIMATIFGDSEGVLLIDYLVGQ
jgi:histone-lysine N-methyltransferase SETMAR